MHGRCGVSDPLVEAISEKVHEDWMAKKLADGITSRPSADGVEQMVPYGDLPDHLKELDRVTVRAVLSALDAAGYGVAPRPGGSA
jgi:hypothetical protein